MKLHYGERAYSFRSPGLFRFLRVLQDAYPGWVDLAGIERCLPGIDPRQLARFIDLLEGAGLPLVRYETKTRGRFELMVEPAAITFSDQQYPASSLAGTTKAQTSFAPKIAMPLPACLDEAWVVWVVALIHSVLALHEGHISGEDGALAHLDTAEEATRTLPLWAASVVHVRRAIALERKSRYREATFWLRRVETAIRQGHAHPAVKARAQLVRAKMRYDQGRYAEAERFLDSHSEPVGADNPNWLNMSALISGRKFLAASETDAPPFLAHTLSALAEALGAVFVGNGDSSLLDGLCYNFGNNLLRGIKRDLIPEASANTVMQWLAANMLVCRKLGVGDDSVLANLLLIDVGMDHGYSVKQWPQLLRYGLNLSDDLKEVLASTLAQAQQTGNRLEIAECLRRQMRLATEPGEARRAYFEALELLNGRDMKDMLPKLADEWRIRFGESPPMLR